jgi:hypothetical protein
MAAGTVLIVDATECKSSSHGINTLSELGARSLRALQSVVKEQVLPVDVGYFEIKIPTESPVIILSQGDGCETRDEDSMLHEFDGGFCPLIHVRLDNNNNPHAVEGSPTASSRDIEEEAIMAHWRLWLAFARTIDVKMGESLAKAASDDFVHSRQINGQLTAGDFNRWLILARLVAMSFGCSEVLPEHWEYTRNLERLRIERSTNTGS